MAGICTLYEVTMVTIRWECLGLLTTHFLGLGLHYITSRIKDTTWMVYYTSNSIYGVVIYLLDWPLTTLLTDFGQSQNILPIASVSCAHTSVGHTYRWQDLLAPSRIKYTSLQSIFHRSNEMAEPAHPLDIDKRLCRCRNHTAHCCIGCGNHRDLVLDQRSYVLLFSRTPSRLKAAS